jgi:N-acetyl-anhydromuramyl-L-alanine amidase AmpD
MARQVTTLPVTEKTVANGNWDTTRKTIDRIVIHTMVGTSASADSRFNNPTQKVSAHYGVLLNGKLWHWVDEDNTAYHAGDYAMNQRSIGIEHEDNGDFNGVRPDALYTTSASLVKDICTFYNIPIDRQHILRHSEVIATGCPDALDIDRIVREASGGQNIQATIDELRTARDTNWNLYQGELTKNNELTKQFEDEQKKSQELRETLDKQTETDANLGAELLDSQHKTNDLISEVSSIATALNTTLDLKSILGAIDALKTPHDEVVKQVSPLLDKLFNAAAYKRLPKKTSTLWQNILNFLHL